MHKVLDVDLFLVHRESLLTPQAFVFAAVSGLLGREMSLNHVEVQVFVSIVRRERVISAKFAQEGAPVAATFALLHSAAGAGQVWSLTKFYSVDFSPSRIVVKNAFSTIAQSRFASAVFDGVLGPLRLARHTGRCPCFSLVPAATHEARQGKGTCRAP